MVERRSMTSWLDDELAECRFADVRLGKRFRTLLETDPYFLDLYNKSQDLNSLPIAV